jgi:hypothetical protein
MRPLKNYDLENHRLPRPALQAVAMTEKRTLCHCQERSDKTIWGFSEVSYDRMITIYFVKVKIFFVKAKFNDYRLFLVAETLYFHTHQPRRGQKQKRSNYR